MWNHKSSEEFSLNPTSPVMSVYNIDIDIIYRYNCCYSQFFFAQAKVAKLSPNIDWKEIEKLANGLKIWFC